jgi:hypothetical protein
MKKPHILTFLALLLVAGCMSPTLEYAAYLQKEGPFVSVPAMTGNIIGSPTMLVGIPLSCIASPVAGEASAGRDMALAFWFPALVGDIVGTPFLVLKKSLWDFPKYIVSDKEEHGSQQEVPPDQ